MKITTQYNFEDIVYLITDTDQFQRIIIGISIHPNNLIMYTLACGTEISDHYEFEISPRCDIVKKTSN